MTGTFTAQSTGDIKVGLYLQGTSGHASFGSVTSSAGLTNCTLDDSRTLTCTWQNAVIGQTRTLAAVVNVATDAVTGKTYQTLACSNAGSAAQRCDTAPLSVVVLPSTLTLVKVVDNGTTGATHGASDWTLTASGPSTVTGVPNSADVTSQSVTAGDYSLSESGPGGYTASAWQCSGATSLTGSTVTIGGGQDVRCEVTSTARPAHLTLVKTVTNDDGGTAAATDWQLSADGPGGTFTGVTGSTAVTNATVAVGDYDLPESAGPSGYTPGAWSCSGGSLSGSVVTLALGDDATCTITNDDAPARYSIAKTSDPASGSTVAPGAVIEYTISAFMLSGVDATQVVVDDDLSGVLGAATLVGTPQARAGTAVVNGDHLESTIPTLSGTESLTYRVRVDRGTDGETLSNTVSSTNSVSCRPGLDPNDPDSPCPNLSVLHVSADAAGGGSSDNGGDLAYTGSDPLPLASACVGLLILGALVVAVSGSRRAAVRIRRDSDSGPRPPCVGEEPAMTLEALEAVFGGESSSGFGSAVFRRTSGGSVEHFAGEVYRSFVGESWIASARPPGSGSGGWCSVARRAAASSAACARSRIRPRAARRKCSWTGAATRPLLLRR